jgi:hypothetical protein
MPLRPLGSILLICLVAAVAPGCQEQQPEAPAGQEGDSAQTPPERRPSAHPRAPKRQKTKARLRVGTAAHMLKRIPTRAQTTSDDYERFRFGHGWKTRDGCSTRQRVLMTESRRGRDIGCHVRRGLWLSAYDGERFRDESELDIDHLVPLGEAWVSGARRWNDGTRERYANDMGYSGTLRAVSAGSNRSKGDRDPAEWMPPRLIHRCKYIGTWIAVKYRWRLAADGDERAVLRRYVEQCGRKADVPVPRLARVRIAKQRTRSTSRERNRTAGRTDRRYGTCAEAIAHGLGPYRKGHDREYNWYRDRDQDDVVCESDR